MHRLVANTDLKARFPVYYWGDDNYAVHGTLLSICLVVKQKATNDAHRLILLTSGRVKNHTTLRIAVPHTLNGLFRP